MTVESLIGRVIELLGIEPVSIEDDEERTFHKKLWFATPTGLPLFGITIFSGDGLSWRVGGASGMPGTTMRQLSQLHEVTCGEAEEKGTHVPAD